MLFSKIRTFFSKHRNKFIVGGILITGSIFLTRYAQQKLKEWQEKEMLEFLDRTRKQQHFENIGRTCNQTILNLSNSLIEALSKIIDTEKIIADLRSNPDNRVTVWESLKVLLIAKLCCLIYSMTMLVIILRIQLNLIGGHLYKDSTSISTEVQEKYLSLTQTLLNHGLDELSSKVIQACKKVMEPVDLKKQLRLCDIDALFWSLQTAIREDAGDPIENLKNYIILDDNADFGEEYRNLVRDTMDLIESDEVRFLASQSVNQGFMNLANQISEFYVMNGDNRTQSSNSSNNYDEFNPRKPLAKLLPIIHGILSKNSFPDKLTQLLVSNEKLQMFGANIYESLL